jgi:DUF1009 family protein
MTTPLAGNEPVGILAGRGRYPYLLAQRIVAMENPVVVAGIEGQFSGNLPPGCGPRASFPLGALGRTAQFFRSCGVRRIYFAGGIDRKGGLLSARPDRHALTLLLRAFVNGDDKLLRMAAKTMRRLGIAVEDPAPILQDLLTPKGLVAGPTPSVHTKTNIAIAWKAAKRLGLRDLGQAATAYDGKVVGLEDRRGTDALLAAAPGPGAVLAKTVKPFQDRRFDLPAIGPSTILIAKAVGLRAIAAEAGGVLLLERDRLISLCQRHNISLVGI